MRFEFATASRIVFGPGTAQEAARSAKVWGEKCCVVTGSNAARSAWLRGGLTIEGLDSLHIAINGEPTVEGIREASSQARRHGASFVVALGGGSVLDEGKAIAALLTNHGDPMEYLEVIGEGKPLPHAAAPCIAIPTTAGTGSEVTRNAVLGSKEHGVKASLRSPSMLPALAIVDPTLCVDLPPSLTAYTGLDALTQLIEPFVCTRANPLTDLYCREGIQRISRSLRAAVRDGKDMEARADMSMASLQGGLALANAGLGVVHGFAAPIGGAFPAPHGAVCAAILPHGMMANVRALRRVQKEHPALKRFQQITTLVCHRCDAIVEEGIDWVDELCHDLAVPRLREYGITEADLPGLAEKASRTSSMKANPIELTQDELIGVLAAAL